MQCSRAGLSILYTKSFHKFVVRLFGRVVQGASLRHWSERAWVRTPQQPFLFLLQTNKCRMIFGFICNQGPTVGARDGITCGDCEEVSGDRNAK